MTRSFLAIFSAFLVIGCGGGTTPGMRAQPMPEILFRAHFTGTAAIQSATNGLKAREILALPAALQLEQALVPRSAAAFAQMITFSDQNAAAQGALLEPLLPELLRRESLIEIRGTTNFVREWIVAVHIEDARAAAWETAFKNLLTHAGTDATSALTYQGAFNGWQAGRKDRSGLYTFIRAGQWSVFNFQRDGRPWMATMAALKSTGRPAPALKDDLLALELDLPSLKKWWPLPDYIDLPKAAITVAAAGQNLRSTARLRFGDAMTWRVEPWRVPTNSLQDPLISFTAVQGIEPWLRRHPAISALEVPFPLRQFLVWAHNDVPFKTLLTTPLPDATNQMKQFGPRLQNAMNTKVTPKSVGTTRTATNGLEVVWIGLPIFAPFVRPASEPGGDFLLGGTMAGLVPTLPNTNPAPRELTGQLTTRTNLVYYDWEITEARLTQWRQMSSLLSMIDTVPSLPSANAAQAWLDALAPLLGNTITEATVENPHELKLVRLSHSGFTGWELVTIAEKLGALLPALAPPPPVTQPPPGRIAPGANTRPPSPKIPSPIPLPAPR